MGKLRKDLSAPGLISTIRDKFSNIPDIVRGNITLTDCLTSGLAVFGLKFPSLLQFEKQKENSKIKHNLRSLYGITNVPSDTYMRERLDVVNQADIRPAYKAIFAALQRGKVLEPYEYLDKHYLLSLDGTGQYSSHSVHCENCCEKHHKDGTITYYHQLLGAVLMHPKHKQVIPLAPEPIVKSDGDNKNDCELNAVKRLLPNIRREHPHLKLIIVEDALSANGPHIKMLQSLDMKFIISVKPDGNKFLFDWIAHEKCVEYEEIGIDDIKRKYKFANNVPLNDANFDLKVNFLEYWEYPKNGGKPLHFSWVTDIEISTDNVRKIMEGGRARWRIENETFNTLKNQGYNFEHNFGHGNKNLCSVFSMLMMLAFLVDQAQNICCYFFKSAKQAARTNYFLWESMRAVCCWFLVDSWEQMYTMIFERSGNKLAVDSS